MYNDLDINKTSLHIASMNGYLKLIKFLIMYDVKIDLLIINKKLHIITHSAKTDLLNINSLLKLKTTPQYDRF
jgi:hypothetical protein